MDTNKELPSVKFSLYHKGAYSVSETPLGEVVIPLQNIDPDGGVTDLWYPIKRSGRMASASGEVSVCLTISLTHILLFIVTTIRRTLFSYM